MEQYETLPLAHEAELIAQNHSTVASFEMSEKRKSKKRQTKKLNTSWSSSSSPKQLDKDFENIKTLSELDAAHALNQDKTQVSVNNAGKNSSDSSENETESLRDFPSDQFTKHEEDDHIISHPDKSAPYTALESTSEIPSPAISYDLTEERREVRMKKLILYSVQALDSIKAEVAEIRKKTIENENVVQNLVLIAKDLSVEVFACVEEIKKRNGLFTDVLVPDIKIPIKKTSRYCSVENALKRHKLVDNLSLCSVGITKVTDT
ncbi:hypothetical protein Bhyg_13212 [Pseudolycoriella hygida]|uniref:Uncharacterized protein n=1 Tax=Pseudolycoriella hygida TaxID=35572 RepID=A0A9Q0MMX0_9DIPT|nr:hypothetical protein Bhyg_13212 [Pseudolycoriella hygida]